MQDKRQGSVLIWIGIVALAVIVLLVFFWKPIFSPMSPGGTQPAEGTPVIAPQGQVVQGFPQDLILDSSAKVNSSYSINYSTSGDQYTAEWTSSSTMATLFNKYKAYLSANGWKITNQQSKSTIDSVYAVNTNGTSANVAIFPKSGGIQVVVSYVAK